MTTLAVRCTGLVKSFGTIRAVDGLDLNVGYGQVLALLGPSACGKTTTLRLIAGFEVPDAGTVEVQGKLVAGPGVYTPPERRRVAMVFQDYALFPHLTVGQNIAYGLPRKERHSAQVKRVLSLTGLEGSESQMPHQLSGGQQQRVALARALAPEPEVLLLDEPFSNLDSGLRTQVRQEVKDILRASGVTAIFVTHDKEEALFMGDLVAVLRGGQVEQVDTPERIFHAPKSQFVATFMGIADFLRMWWTAEGPITEIGTLPAPSGVHQGQGVKAMVRPDDVSFYPSPEGRSRIVGKVFQGAFYLYKLELPSGASVHSLQPHTADYPLDTLVTVRLDSGHSQPLFFHGHALLE